MLLKHRRAAARSKAWASAGSASLGIQWPQSSSVALIEVQEPSLLPLSAHLIAWDSAGPWVGSEREPWQKLRFDGGKVNGSRVHVRERLKRLLLWLIWGGSGLSSCTLQLQMLFRGSERDSPAVSSTRLLGPARTILTGFVYCCFGSLQVSVCPSNSRVLRAIPQYFSFARLAVGQVEAAELQELPVSGGFPH